MHHRLSDADHMQDFRRSYARGYLIPNLWYEFALLFLKHEAWVVFGPATLKSESNFGKSLLKLICYVLASPPPSLSQGPLGW